MYFVYLDVVTDFSEPESPQSVETTTFGKSSSQLHSYNNALARELYGTYKVEPRNDSFFRSHLLQGNDRTMSIMYIGSNVE